jgi:hypothetical protein
VNIDRSTVGNTFVFVVPEFPTEVIWDHLRLDSRWNRDRWVYAIVESWQARRMLTARKKVDSGIILPECRFSFLVSVGRVGKALIQSYGRFLNDYIRFPA